MTQTKALLIFQVKNSVLFAYSNSQLICCKTSLNIVLRNKSKSKSKIHNKNNICQNVVAIYGSFGCSQ